MKRLLMKYHWITRTKWISFDETGKQETGVFSVKKEPVVSNGNGEGARVVRREKTEGLVEASARFDRKLSTRIAPIQSFDSHMARPWSSKGSCSYNFPIFVRSTLTILLSCTSIPLRNVSQNFRLVESPSFRGFVIDRGKSSGKKKQKETPAPARERRRRSCRIALTRRKLWSARCFVNFISFEKK